MRYLLVALVLTACASHTQVTCEINPGGVGSTSYCRDVPVNGADLRAACPDPDGLQCVGGEARCQIVTGSGSSEQLGPLRNIVCGDSYHDISLE